MKNVHALMRLFNMPATTKGVGQLKSTLQHSFRLSEETPAPALQEASQSQASFNPPVELKPVQWDESLSSKNLMWRNGSIVSLDSLDDGQKRAIVHKIMPAPRLRNQSSLRTKRSKLKHKLKNFKAQEQKLGNDELARWIGNVGGTAADMLVEEAYLKRLQSATMNRHAQKIKTIEQFVKLHNQLVDVRRTRNSTHVQEAIFKIPHQWEVTDDDISGEEWLAFVHKFYTHYFPAFPIHALILHADERLADEATGSHVHAFISGRNSIHNVWDLLKTQIEVVNAYHQSKSERLGVTPTLVPENCVLPKSQYKIHGVHMQEMFRDFINEELLHAKGLHVVLAPDEERESKASKVRDRQAKLPKSQREYNYEKRQREVVAQLETEAKQLEAHNKEAEQLNASLDSDTLTKITKALELGYLATQYQQRGLKHKSEAVFLKLAAHIEEQTGLNMVASLMPHLNAAQDEPSMQANGILEQGNDR